MVARSNVKSCFCCSADVFRNAQAQAQAEKATAAAAAADAANAETARRNGIIIGVVVAVGIVAVLLLLRSCLMKTFVRTKQILKARKDAREAKKGEEEVEEVAGYGNSSKSLSFKELPERAHELPTVVKTPSGNFTAAGWAMQGYQSQGHRGLTAGQRAVGSAGSPNGSYISDDISSTSGISWGSYPPAAATTMEEVYYSESLPSHTVSTTSSDSMSPGAAYPLSSPRFNSPGAYPLSSPRFDSPQTQPTSHLLRSPVHGPLRRAFGTGFPVNAPMDFPQQVGYEAHTGNMVVTRFPSSGGSPSTASAPASLGVTTAPRSDSRRSSFSVTFNPTTTEGLLQSPTAAAGTRSGAGNSPRRHPTPYRLRPVTRVILSGPRPMMISPFAQVQQPEASDVPRFVITDSDDDAAGRSDDSRRHHSHQQQQQPGAQLNPFSSFGVHAQPFRVTSDTKQYRTSSTATTAVGGSAGMQDSMRSAEGPGDQMRSTSRSRERRSAYWAVFGEKMEEARKGAAGRDGGWDQC